MIKRPGERRILQRAGVLAVGLACVIGFLDAGGAGAGAAAWGSASSAGAFTRTETISRSFQAIGSKTVVDTRTVTLRVSNTTDLQGRQEIGVSWSGAHPTGGIVANPNSAAGENEEYPMVLLECRGGASGPDQVTPQSCWTQDWESRYQDSANGNREGTWPSYTLDSYQSKPGAAIVGAPPSLPAGDCRQEETAAVQYWVPWAAANGTVYDGGLGGACGEPPEATDVGGSAVPSNEIYGVTGTDGTGKTNFDVLNATENATLACSTSVACSLVAVPIMGISCDGDLWGRSPTPDELTSLAACKGTGFYQPGALQAIYNGQNEKTVSGVLWWSPSNWRNRITIPLTFAPSPDVCKVVASGNVVDVYGSELMLQATSQWEPYFCLTKKAGFSFAHVSEGEPQARNQVAQGTAEAAFTSFGQPGGYGRPVVNAPVAATSFAISYAIDDANGDPISTLELTPRLLAKLMTESYPALTAAQGGDPSLAGNPLDIAKDPDFVALNPEIGQGVTNTAAASALVSLSSDSDVIEALTTYINDDPSARAWLDGRSSGEPSVCNAQGVYEAGAADPCPKMVVNPAYRGIHLPVEQWPLLSRFVSDPFDSNPTNAPCLQNNPVPLASLIAAPVETLQNVSLDLQFRNANSTLTCSSNAEQTVNSMVANGAEVPGHLFLIGVTPLADDYRYGLQAAELQTTPGTFVGPSNASLEAAAHLLKPDPSTGTWPIPYRQFQTTAGTAAYPGTMLVYAAVPTSGLPGADAADYAALLRFAAATGQTSGNDVGQLAPGYLPLTTADGLGALADYTTAAAADVAAQNGRLPSMTAPLAATPSESTPSSSALPSSAWSSLSSNASTAPVTFTADSTGAGQSQHYDAAVGTMPTSSSPLLPGLVSGSSSRATAGGSAIEPVRFVSVAGRGDHSLWTHGLPVVLLVGLAFLGALIVPALYFFGRRLGRW